MGPFMRFTPRAGRGLGAALLLAACIAAPAHALQISTPIVTPGTVVPVGTRVSITFTVTGETGSLSNLSVITSARNDCDPPSGPPATNGVFTLYPSNYFLVSDEAASSATLNFGGQTASGTTFVVVWQFTATRSGSVSYSAFAYDLGSLRSEGCADPSGVGYCPVFNTIPTVTDLNTCNFATITITSSLTGHAVLRGTSGGIRPAATVYVEDPVQVLFSATHTGTSGSFVIRAATTSTPDTESTLVGTPGTTPAFPVTLVAPGSQANLLWNYTIPAATAPGQVMQFRVDAEGVYAFSNALSVTAAPLAITTTVLVDPDGFGPLPWAPAANSWLYVDDEMYVVATVANTSTVFTYTVDPAITPSSGLVATTARVPVGPQALGVAPASVSFTWRYVIDRSAAATYQQCYSLTDPPDMGWTVRTRGVSRDAGLPVKRNDPGPTVPFAFTLQAPPVVDFGATFSATLFMVNATGTTVTLDASATPYLEPQPLGSPKVSLLAGPVPQGNRQFAPGQKLGYVFVFQATAGGNQALRSGLRYAGSDQCVSAFPGGVEIVAPSPYVSTLTPSKTLVNSGELYTLTLIVSNTTTCQSSLDPASLALAQSPQMNTILSATYTATGACAGGFPCNIPGGGSATFVWWAKAQDINSCGAQTWSASAAGVWGGACTGAGAFTRPFASSAVTVRERGTLVETGSVPASLGVSLATATGVVEGGTVTLVLTVDPAGQNSLANFSVAVAQVSATCSGCPEDPVLTPLTAPVPAFPFTLTGCGLCTNGLPCPAQRATYTWTYAATSKGSGTGFFWFTLTAGGQDQFDGTAVAAHVTTPPVRVLRASTLWVDVDTEPVPGTCMFDVVMNVDTIGDTNVVPTLIGITPMSATSVASAGPVLADPYFTPTGFSIVRWTYSPVGAGSVDFSVSVVGSEIMKGGVVYASATLFAPEVILPATLSASAWLDKSTGTTQPGQTVNLFLKVTNVGNLPSTGPLGVTAWLGASAVCGAPPSPLPGFLTAPAYDPAIGIEGCGNSQTFVWSWTLTTSGQGALQFTATITAFDPLAAGQVSASAYSGCLVIANRPPLLVSIASLPEFVLVGHDFDVTLTLENSGSTLIRATPAFPPLDPSNPDLIIQPLLSTVPLDLFPGQKKSYVVRVKARLTAAPGAALVRVGAAPFAVIDLSAGGAVPVAPSAAPATITILANKPDYTLRTNPYNPLKGELPIHFVNPGGGPLSIRAYTMAGELVATILDAAAAPEEGTKTWAGTNEEGTVVATGIYLIRFEGKDLKTTKKLAVVK